MVVGTVLYVMLEVALIGAVSRKNVTHNWLNPIPGAGQFGPYATLATSAGVGWLATFLYIDAVVSPGGTGLVYTGTSARLSYGLGRSGYAPSALGRVDKRGVPFVSLIFCFAIGMLVLLPFPSWAGSSSSASRCSSPTGAPGRASDHRRSNGARRPGSCPGCWVWGSSPTSASSPVQRPNPGGPLALC